MNLHDASLDTLTLTKSRELILVLSGVPGWQAGARLIVRVRKPQLVILSGTIEEDWFLSSVLFSAPGGEEIDIAQTREASIGRLIVQGTNGAFIELVGGQMSVEGP